MPIVCPAEAEPAVVVRGDLVVARPGPDGVVAGSAAHADRELGAAHLVVAGAEHQPHRAHHDPVAAGADRGSRPQVDRDAVGGAAEAHHVDPERRDLRGAVVRPGVEPVVARAADDLVAGPDLRALDELHPAAAAVEPVVARAPVEQVGPVAAAQDVVACQTRDPVLAGQPGDHVAARTATEHVVAGGADEGGALPFWHITTAAAEVGTATAYDATGVPSAVSVTARLTRGMWVSLMRWSLRLPPASRGGRSPGKAVRTRCARS